MQNLNHQYQQQMYQPGNMGDQQQQQRQMQQNQQFMRQNTATQPQNFQQMSQMPMNPQNQVQSMNFAGNNFQSNQAQFGEQNYGGKQNFQNTPQYAHQAQNMMAGNRDMMQMPQGTQQAAMQNQMMQYQAQRKPSVQVHQNSQIQGHQQQHDPNSAPFMNQNILQESSQKINTQIQQRLTQAQQVAFGQNMFNQQQQQPKQRIFRFIFELNTNLPEYEVKPTIRAVSNPNDNIKEIHWPEGMHIEQMQLEIQRASGFPITLENYGRVNLWVMDKDDNVVLLSEDMDFNQVYKVKQFSSGATSAVPNGGQHQFALYQQYVPTQNHSILYSPDASMQASCLFKSPHIGESYKQYRGSVNNWQQQNQQHHPPITNIQEQRLDPNVPATPQPQRNRNQQVADGKTDPRSGSYKRGLELTNVDKISQPSNIKLPNEELQKYLPQEQIQGLFKFNNIIQKSSDNSMISGLQVPLVMPSFNPAAAQQFCIQSQARSPIISQNVQHDIIDESCDISASFIARDSDQMAFRNRTEMIYDTLTNRNINPFQFKGMGNKAPVCPDYSVPQVNMNQMNTQVDSQPHNIDYNTLYNKISQNTQRLKQKTMEIQVKQQAPPPDIPRVPYHQQKKSLQKPLSMQKGRMASSGSELMNQHVSNSSQRRIHSSMNRGIVISKREIFGDGPPPTILEKESSHNSHQNQNQHHMSSHRKDEKSVKCGNNTLLGLSDIEKELEENSGIFETKINPKEKKTQSKEEVATPVSQQKSQSSAKHQSQKSQSIEVFNSSSELKKEVKNKPIDKKTAQEIEKLTSIFDQKTKQSPIPQNNKKQPGRKHSTKNQPPRVNSLKIRDSLLGHVREQGFEGFNKKEDSKVINQSKQSDGPQMESKDSINNKVKFTMKDKVDSESAQKNSSQVINKINLSIFDKVEMQQEEEKHDQKYNSPNRSKSGSHETLRVSNDVKNNEPEQIKTIGGQVQNLIKIETNEQKVLKEEQEKFNKEKKDDDDKSKSAIDTASWCQNEAQDIKSNTSIKFKKGSIGSGDDTAMAFPVTPIQVRRELKSPIMQGYTRNKEKEPNLDCPTPKGHRAISPRPFQMAFKMRSSKPMTMDMNGRLITNPVPPQPTQITKPVPVLPQPTQITKPVSPQPTQITKLVSPQTNPFTTPIQTKRQPSTPLQRSRQMEDDGGKSTKGKRMIMPNAFQQMFSLRNTQFNKDTGQVEPPKDLDKNKDKFDLKTPVGRTGIMNTPMAVPRRIENSVGGCTPRQVPKAFAALFEIRHKTNEPKKNKESSSSSSSSSSDDTPISTSTSKTGQIRKKLLIPSKKDSCINLIKPDDLQEVASQAFRTPIGRSSVMPSLTSNIEMGYQRDKEMSELDLATPVPATHNVSEYEYKQIGSSNDRQQEKDMSHISKVPNSPFLTLKQNISGNIGGIQFDLEQYQKSNVDVESQIEPENVPPKFGFTLINNDPTTPIHNQKELTTPIQLVMRQQESEEQHEFKSSAYMTPKPKASGKFVYKKMKQPGEKGQEANECVTPITDYGQNKVGNSNERKQEFSDINLEHRSPFLELKDKMGMIAGCPFNIKNSEIIELAGEKPKRLSKNFTYYGSFQLNSNAQISEQDSIDSSDNSADENDQVDDIKIGASEDNETTKMNSIVKIITEDQDNGVNIEELYNSHKSLKQQNEQEETIQEPDVSKKEESIQDPKSD